MSEPAPERVTLPIHLDITSSARLVDSHGGSYYEDCRPRRQSEEPEERLVSGVGTIAAAIIIGAIILAGVGLYISNRLAPAPLESEERAPAPHAPSCIWDLRRCYGPYNGGPK